MANHQNRLLRYRREWRNLFHINVNLLESGVQRIVESPDLLPVSGQEFRQTHYRYCSDHTDERSDYGREQMIFTAHIGHYEIRQYPEVNSTVQQSDK